MKVSLVIPLFNNEKTAIAQLDTCNNILKKICDEYEIIVCEDKSTDSSAKLLKDNFQKNKNFSLIFHRQNLGIAKTIRELYKKAHYDYVVLFSVDGDWNPQDIQRLLRAAKKKHADIVIGKRTYTEYSLYRKIISFFYNFLPLLLFQIQTIDAGSIKVIKKEIIQKTPIISKGVFSDAEIIIRTIKKGKRVISIPIHFSKKENEKGSGGKMLLVLQSLRDLFLLRLYI